MAEKKPGVYIPTLYFAEGLPYTVVMMMSGVFFKSLGADNIFIGLTSFLGLPWILKFAWAPLVDFYATKKGWIVVAQMVLALAIAGLAGVAFFSGAISFDSMVAVAVVALALTAFASATHDVAIDGYYLDVLNDEQKAFFVGVRNTAYKVAWLFGSGAMVYLAGKLAETGGIGLGWAVAFGICALAMLASGIFHSWYLPQTKKTWDIGEVAQARSEKQEHGTVTVSWGHEFLRAIGTYFAQPGIVPIVLYILLFRLGDALMLKQAPNFLLDPATKGGLGISVADIGIINGTVGVIALLAGGILGSWLISKYGLRKCFWPLALFQNGAILLYWVLAAFPHGFVVQTTAYNPHLPAVYVINSIEQFAYGMGVAAYTVFLMTTVRNEYKAAHYATATALMALGLMLPGAISGYLYQALGYANFFLVSFFASLPGIFAIFFLPIWHDERPIAVGESGGDASGVSKAGQVGSESK
jgi:MFS transporter, PAT family, beta-lactamase induction signal transducer AmpG